MRVLAIGDPHAKRSSLNEFMECGRRSAQIIMEKKPHLVVILGDISHDHEIVYTLCLGAITDFLMNLRSACQSVGGRLVVLVGNHDFSNNSQFLTSNHSLTAFKHFSDILVVDTPSILRVPGYNLDIVACPYTPNGRFHEAIESSQAAELSLHNNPNAIIFAHQEFRGAQMGAIYSKTGDEWPLTGAHIFSGHIHERQVLQNNILYIGTPYQQSFGDTDEKTISLFEFDNTHKLVWSEERIDLKMPKKKIINLTVEEAKTFVPPSGISVRINLAGTREEILAFRKTPKYTELSQLAKINVLFTDAHIAVTNKKYKSYLDILRDNCQAESSLVQETFDEVTQNENQAQKL